MDKVKTLKIIALNMGISILNILVFSPGFLGVSLSSMKPFQASLGYTTIIMSIAIFFYGNKMFLLKENGDFQFKENEELENYIDVIEKLKTKKTFEKDIEKITVQIERVQKKRELAKRILLNTRSRDKLGYNIIEVTISSVEELFSLFVSNISNVIHKIEIFDEDDYYIVKKNKQDNELTSKYTDAQLDIYNEYIIFVKDIIESNEQIIHQFDKLSYELANLEEASSTEIFNMESLKEFEKTINILKTKKINNNNKK